MTSRIVLCLMVWGWAAAATAAQVQVRENDHGVMREVPTVECEEFNHFGDADPNDNHQNERKDYTADFGSMHWGSILDGMTEDCLEPPRSRCYPANRNDPTCFEMNGAVRGSHPDGGVTHPTVPLKALRRGNLNIGRGAASHVSQPWSGEHITGGSALMPYLGCGSWGDGPLAMTFDNLPTAICLDLVFIKDHDGQCTVGERYHVEFWDKDGNHIGHQDIIKGGPDMITNPRRQDCHQTFCWESEVGIGAVTTWVQNGPGAAWDSVCIGTAALAPEPEPEPEPDPVDACIEQCVELCGICTP